MSSLIVEKFKNARTTCTTYQILYILPILSIDRFILYQINFTFVIEEYMKKIFFLFLSTFLTLTIIFCGDEKEEFTATITTTTDNNNTDDSLRSRWQAVVNNISIFWELVTHEIFKSV